MEKQTLLTVEQLDGKNNNCLNMCSYIILECIRVPLGCLCYYSCSYICIPLLDWYNGTKN